MKLFIFDCDGTLVDSQHMIVAAMTTAFIANGLTPPERGHMVRHVGLSVPEAMSAMTGVAGGASIIKLSADYRAAFAALRKAANIADPMFPGARETLLTLAARDDVALAIATGKSRRGLDALLEREGLASVFMTIQTADDAPSKPHPAMIYQAMDAVGAGPAETVMVGDTTFDVLMARAASVTAIGVSWGYHDAAELTQAGAVAVASDFRELLSLVLPGERMVAA